jgi:ABC-type antimicrobial peptide transport system permease subunit
MLALGYFIFRDLLHDRWRSLLTILSLAVVVVGYLLLASLSQAMVILSRQAKVTNNLLILAADTIDPMDSSINEDALQIAREIAPDQIRLAFPILFRHLTIDGKLMQVRSVALEEMSTSVGLTLVQGDWPDGPRQIVVSEGAAELASWKIGSTVNIYGTDFQVTGLVRAEESAFGSVWMTYEEGLRLFGSSHGFQVGYLSLVPSEDPESVRAMLLADPRISAAYSVYLEHAFTNSYNQSNSNLLILSGLMVLISLLVVTFGVFNATTLSLSERSLEIGLLHVIGFTLNKLRRFLLARALALTLTAYSLGWLISLVFINHQRLHATVDLIFLTLKLTPFSCLIGLGLAVIFAFLGVWLASRRLTEQNPLTGSD